MKAPPVLLITFNRPEHTRRVLNALRSVRPASLYWASDGPREARPGEAAVVAQVRGLVSSEVDWDCQVRTLFQPTNLGCRRGVQAAIQWFFSQVEEGIILEDDIVPDPSFFQFQAELLAKYRDDPRVMLIAGHQSLGAMAWKESYRFSQFAAIWGWGSWRRAWQDYEPLAESFGSSFSEQDLKRRLRHPELVDWWQGSLRAIQAGKIDTWDIQLCYHLMRKNGLCVVPATRLTQNVGFGAGATHTTGGGADEPPPGTINFPLVHPTHLVADRGYDLRHAKKNFWNRHVRWSWRMYMAVRQVVRKVLGRTS